MLSAVAIFSIVLIGLIVAEYSVFFGYLSTN